MNYISKLFKETKLGELIKEKGINSNAEKKNKEEKNKEEKNKEEHHHFSDNHDDDNWTY